MRRPQAQKKPFLGHAASVLHITGRSAYIDPELLPLFDQVRRSIKGSPHMSRTEAFLQWVEENPGAVLRAQEELAARELRKLMHEQRATGHEMKRAKRSHPTPEELAAIPF